MAEDLETRYEAAIADGTILGAVVFASNAAGSFSYQKALGKRTLLSGETRPQQPDDVLFLASATKLIASIAALQCVEDGLLTLTGDLSRFAPELASKQVLTGWSDDGETPILEDANPERPITLEMLLTHSAGTTYDFADPKLAKWSQKTGHAWQDGMAPRPVEEAFKYPLGYQPGTSWMYGNGLDWAGRIVERATGRTLGEHVAERIAAPLGIDSASFYPVVRADLRARMTDLNPADPDGVGLAVLGGVFDMNRRSKGAFGGHGLFMAGDDYAKVLRSLLANDGKLLRRETVDDMFADHLSAEAAAAYTAVARLPWGVSFTPGIDGRKVKLGHGLGGALALDGVPGYMGAGTMVWGGGQTHTWFIDRANDLCGFAGLQVPIPIDSDPVQALKQVFRDDAYREYSAWREKDGNGAS